MLRRTVRTIVLLTLGLLTTVGTAWLFALADLRAIGDRAVRRVHGDGPPAGGRTPAFEFDSAGCLFVTRYARWGAASWSSWAASRSWQPVVGTPSMEEFRIIDGRTPEDITPWWLRDDLLPWVRGRDSWPGDDGLRESDRREAHAAGWPMLALWCAERAEGYGYVVDGGIDVPSRTRAVGGGVWGGWAQPVRLPYRPVWLGLIVNTALFAAAWGVLLLGPGALRRRQRRRAGRCVKCAYDLQGLPTGAPCPECGGKG